MALLLKGKVIHEFGIQSPAAKFFNVFIKQLHDVHNIAERVHEGKVHEGDWHDVGSIKIWTAKIDGKVETYKESIEVIDEENKSVTYNIFDGEVSKKYKTFKVNLQVIDKEDIAGGVVKWTLEYEKLNEDIEAPYHYLEYATHISKDIDAHLVKA